MREPSHPRLCAARPPGTAALALLCALWLSPGCDKCSGATGKAEERDLSTLARDAAASEVALVDSVLPPGDPGVVDIRLEVRADRGLRPISPLIYGANFSEQAEAQRWGLVRSGGNRLTAYNWENNASNAGSDWNFQNDDLLSKSDEPAKPLLETIDAANAVGAATIITLSNADYVAADKRGDGDVRKSGPDYLAKRFKRNHPRKPGAFTKLPDVTDDAVYQDELVAFLKAHRPQAQILFSMDNEPELWSHTHAEIFAKPVTYADLWRRNQAFSHAAKRAWPEAEVLGFVSYGYAGFLTLQDAPDAQGRDFIDWYLGRAKAAEREAGRRLIDYLDLHWYPEVYVGDTRITTDSIEPDVIEARLQAPRSLWDAKYKEASWITEKLAGPIRLIPRMRDKIAAHYPGTKLAITEWNYGGGQHISGAMAVADALGSFGRHGVDLAAYWPLNRDESFAISAFRLFRNFDGKGAAFGDVSLPVTSSNVAKAVAYASLDRKDPTRTVIVLLNKSSTKKRAGVMIAHSTVYSKAQLFVLAGKRAVIVKGPTLQPVATNSFAYEMPAQSITVIVPER